MAKNDTVINDLKKRGAGGQEKVGKENQSEQRGQKVTYVHTDSLA